MGTNAIAAFPRHASAAFALPTDNGAAVEEFSFAIVGEIELVAVQAAAGLAGDSAIVSALLLSLALSSPQALVSEGNLTVEEATEMRKSVSLGLLADSVGASSTSNAPYAVRAVVS